MTSWDVVVEAVGLALSGERDQGRAQLLACWQEATSSDHAQRCVLAHHVADLEGELDAEVAWDERALSAYAGVGAGDLASIGIPDAAGMAASLHLNLGDGYLRQGRREQARAQLDAGLGAQDALGHDGYAAMVGKGLEGLRLRLADSTQGAAAPPRRPAERSEDHGSAS